jgi:large subunit ribosomal protein L22
MKVDESLIQLKFLKKKAAGYIRKLLESAVANAKNNYQDLKEKDLIIKELVVEAGPTYHRYRPRAHGRATPIRKKTSRIKVELEALKEAEKKEEPKAKPKTVRAESEEEVKKRDDKEDKSGGPKKGKKVNKRVDFVRKMFRRKSV